MAKVSGVRSNKVYSSVLPDNIPEELRRRAQWVVWKLEVSHGKLTKVPYIAGARGKASCTDSLTWRAFDEAVETLNQSRCNGIGFVFSSGDPYAGVDLDDCRDPENGKLDEWAARVVENLGGYAEVSPSGTGVHIIVRGEAPNKRRGKVEAYCSKRYFAMTGIPL